MVLKCLLHSEEVGGETADGHPGWLVRFRATELSPRVPVHLRLQCGTTEGVLRSGAVCGGSRSPIQVPPRARHRVGVSPTGYLGKS